MKIEKPKSSQPIPGNAKKVFSGVMFDVYQWEQEMYDGGVRTFEKVKRADTVDVISITKDGNILVLEQQQPGKETFFSLPGGRINEGEDPLEAAKRELLEETGYASDELNLWLAVQPTGKVEWAMYFFIAKNCRKISQQELDGGERISVNSVSTEEFLELIFSQKIKSSEFIVKFFREGLIAFDKEKSVENIKKHFEKF